MPKRQPCCSQVQTVDRRVPDRKIILAMVLFAGCGHRLMYYEGEKCPRFLPPYNLKRHE